ERLGLEKEFLAQAESRFGASAALALSRALERAAAGDPEGGLEHLRKAAAAKPGDLAVQIAIARYLERIGSVGALKAWVEVGRKNPASLDAQRACLTADAASGDREFVERTIRRYTGLMGPDATEDHFCRCARARALVFRTPSRR